MASHLLDTADAGLEVPQRVSNVLDLFCDIVDSNPSAPAVSWRDVDITYQELDALSSQVANALITSGAVKGSIVALFLNDPIDQIAATLGCLKAGCVFASLDVSYPEKRLLHMLEKVRARWVILEPSTHDIFSSLLKEKTDATINILVMGEDRVRGKGVATQREGVLQVVEQGTDRILVPTLPDDPCYVYFTSGSTGKPKAILGRIRGLAHFIQWEIAAFSLGPGSRVSQLTGPAFDVYLRDVFAPLCSGGTVCIPSAARCLDPILLERWIEQARITLVHCVPSVFRLLLRQGLAPGKFPALEFVLLAGESLPPADANAWITCFGERIRLVNLYGPTETTLAKFFYRLPTAPIADAFVPIGMPIPGAQAILLDESLVPCAQGELGEIFIRTPYRTLGYYDDPDLTESAFIRNPFTAETSDLLYRTGDLAQVLPDGNFRFAGRKDFQVKIGGTRIELGEIEARLREHPGVREAAVLAREDRPGDTRLVAYYVPRSSAGEIAAVSIPELRRHLVDLLPPFMVPASYVMLESLPLTVNGKLDRGALPAPGTSRPEQAVAYAPPIDGDERRLCEAFAAVLGIERVGRHDNFFEIGGSSLLAASLLARVQEGTVREIPATLIFGNPTPASLAVALAQDVGSALEAHRLPRAHRSVVDVADHAVANEPIAIIAMAGRFPGASDVEQFWDNLCAGQDSITVFRPDQLDPSIAAADRLDPAYVPARGIIDGVENFDAGFFGINPREAELMDPQHRIFLELCWECMERAGQVPDATTVPVGVFAGTYHSTYLRRHVAAHPDLVEKVGAYQVILDNEKDYIATRIAHKLNLTGPAISMYTACSTSLVAICQALESLRTGSCDMALAGGISIICPPRSGHRYQEGAMFSPDGYTRTFDAQAQGTVFSDGAAVVLLKRLSDAIKDGNPVHAVILGGAVNNDGGGKASFTAPSSAGQAAVIAMAQTNARVSPRSISYVEAHGTATPMGDPIEIEGLVKAFRRDTPDVGFCRIGSVKSNVGHLVIAAGAAGVIKTALSLARRKIPASLHFNRANPVIDFSASPFVVNSGLSEWTSDEAPRRAGVSSFGVGGTNAHVVLEQAPPLPESEAALAPNLLVLSARSPLALAQATENLATFLHADLERAESETSPGLQAVKGLNLADVAWTLAVGRKSFPHRVAVVATHAQEAISQLRSPELAVAIKRSRPARHSDVVFAFPGQGSHYTGMGRALYETEPAFATAFDQCVEVLRSNPGLDLRGLVFSDDPEALLPTAVMQPAIFSIEYALARLWMSQGLNPVAMIGHSIGEFVAVTLAGVFALPDALRLVAQRGALMQAQPAGGMLSVRLGLEALLARLPAGLSLAAENAPGACVVAGPIESIADFQTRLDAEGIACRALRTSHAFHSVMMEPVIAPFRDAVEAAARSAPLLPIVSTVTGDWLDADSAMSTDYWSRHLRQPVRFAAALARVATDAPSRVLLEVGPRATLSLLARQHPEAQKAQVVAVPSLADAPGLEAASLRWAAGQLWCSGVAIDVAQFDRRGRRLRVRLPTYPFERKRCWVEAATTSNVVQLPARPAAVPHVVDATPATPVDTSVAASTDRRTRLLAQLRDMFGDITGFDMAVADAEANFIELGLDSLMLTQIAVQLQKAFAVPVTFRQLMTDYASLERLSGMLDASLPAEPVVAQTAVVPASPSVPVPVASASASAPTVAPATPVGPVDIAVLCQMIEQQMQLLAQQLALLRSSGEAGASPGLAFAVASAAQADAEAVSTAAAAAAIASVPVASSRTLMDAAQPLVPGARIGREPDGRPAWFVPNPDQPGKYLKVGT
jgi:amino acid adenylation domain-containing protein